jgi:hypothetical protein
MARSELVVQALRLDVDLSAYDSIATWSLRRSGTGEHAVPRRDLARLDLGYRDLVGLRPPVIWELLARSLWL